MSKKDSIDIYSNDDSSYEDIYSSDIYSNGPARKGSKHPKKKKSRAGRHIKRALALIGKLLVTLMLVVVITGSIVVTALTVYVMKFVDPDAGVDLHKLQQGYQTTIYTVDASGKEKILTTLEQSVNKEWADLSKIPQHVRDAFIYTEDERFMEHDGVDWKRTFGAFVNMFINIYGFRQGGSTITQQVIKNLTGDDDVRIERKVQEIFRAINLERKYTKDEILEAYLNVIHLGRNTNGVQAASKLYFNKDVSKLTIVEAAALAAMTRNPVGYDPINHPDKNKDRREYVLKQMYEHGAITEQEYKDGLNTELETHLTKPSSSGVKEYQSYFVDHLVNQIIADLMEQKGWSEEKATQQLYNNGYKIYATVDPELQTLLEKKFKESSTFSSKVLKDPPQAAMIIMDHYGNIKAVVGGRGEKPGNRVLNRATQSVRSPGSSIKPWSVYAPAIENDLITYSTMVKDEPLKNVLIGGKRRDWPNNYTKRNYGTLPVEQALQRSLNTIPVKLLQDLTLQRSYDFLTQKVGLTTLVENNTTSDGTTQTDLSLGNLAMGDMVKGTKLSELTAAFQIFANGGTYAYPTSYTKVLDSNDKELLVRDNSKGKRAISEETSGVMNKLLQRVVEGPYGTGKAAKISGTTVIGKTGTSNTYNDQLFVGATPYYVAGLWYGYDTPKSVEGIGMYPVGQIWKNVMQDAHKDLPEKEFTISDKVVKKQYCTKTGLIAKSGCPKATGYYKSSNIPKTCSGH